MKFTVQGHANILGKHKTTLEFTRDSELRKEGDCIIGIGADFKHEALLRFVAEHDKAKAVISAEGISDEVHFSVNKSFCDKHEIVIRKGNFISSRTLGIHADKGATDLDRGLIHTLRQGKEAVITLEKAV